MLDKLSLAKTLYKSLITSLTFVFISNISAAVELDSFPGSVQSTKETALSSLRLIFDLAAVTHLHGSIHRGAFWYPHPMAHP